MKVKNLKKQYITKKSFFSKKFDLIYALDGINFEIREGEVLGLVGESGCGKTTCGKLLLRLITPTSGEIFFEGRDVNKISASSLRRFRKDTQMVFQDPYESLNPRFTVFDSVSEPLIIQGKISYDKMKERVIKVLEEVELKPADEFLYRFPHELSGGQRQRVAIARAQILEPKFIVVDEPVSMLDVSIRTQILNLMLDLKERFNLTFLFITHDLSVARYICDRIAVMYLGKILEEGDTEDIISAPLHPYTKALLSCVPIPDPEIKRESPRIKGRISHTKDEIKGCRFYLRCLEAKDRCLREEPGRKEISFSHSVSCFLF